MTQAQIKLIIRLIRRHPRFAWLIVSIAAFVAGVEIYQAHPPPHQIAALIKPARLEGVGPRAANPHVQKYVAILEEARRSGRDPVEVATKAVTLMGLDGEGADLTVQAMLRNRNIAERLGCLTNAGLREMHQGRAPTVMNGPYKGDKLSVDHIIPYSVHPELDKVIANLELMPLRMNESKHARMGERQVDLLQKLRAAGLAISEVSSSQTTP